MHVRSGAGAYNFLNLPTADEYRRQIMNKAVHIFTIIFSVLLVANFAFAEAEKWEIDKAHSNIYFDVRHTYATVRGQFNEFSGVLKFDPNNMEKSRVTFEVDTRSINTGIPERDNHLRSDDFFAVKKFPTMTFQSTGVKPKEGNQYTLEGNLTIKGKTGQIAVPLTYYGTRENPLKKGQRVAGFEARITINRLDYQVGPGKYAEMGVIGEKVEILIALEALKDK
jgi:polyisoprenoid-binding protein YceI